MRALVLMPLVLLLACKSEPSFDERYDAAEKQIRDKADALDAELEKRAKEAERVTPAGEKPARDTAP